MNTVPLATFNELEPAQHLKQRLDQAGIPAAINDESRLERLWFISKPIAAIHVVVAQPEYLRAHRLVAEWDNAEGVLKNAMHCPNCGSTRVEFPQMPRKFMSPRLLGFLLALRVVPKEFYCLDCHHTCPTVEKLEPVRDPLGWSYESKHWHPEAGGRTQRSSNLTDAWRWVVRQR